MSYHFGQVSFATWNGQRLAIASASYSYGKLSSGNANPKNVLDGDGSTGWSTSGREGEPHQLVVNLEQPVAGDGELVIERLFERHYAAGLAFRIVPGWSHAPRPFGFRPLAGQ